MFGIFDYIHKYSVTKMYFVFIYCIYISILGSNRGLHHYSVNMRVKLFENTSFTLQCVIKEFMAFFF